MQSKFYVESLDTWVDKSQTKIIVKHITVKIKNDTFTINDAKVRIYLPTKEEVDDHQTDSETQNRFFNLYAEKNNLLTKTEIIKIRHHLHLSQQEFANLLRVSKATIEHYELGTLPNQRTSQLIRLVKYLTPEQVQQQLKKN